MSDILAAEKEKVSKCPDGIWITVNQEELYLGKGKEVKFLKPDGSLVLLDGEPRHLLFGEFRPISKHHHLFNHAGNVFFCDAFAWRKCYHGEVYAWIPAVIEFLFTCENCHLWKVETAAASELIVFDGLQLHLAGDFVNCYMPNLVLAQLGGKTQLHVLGKEYKMYDGIIEVLEDEKHLIFLDDHNMEWHFHQNKIGRYQLLV